MMIILIGLCHFNHSFNMQILIIQLMFLIIFSVLKVNFIQALKYIIYILQKMIDISIVVVETLF